MLRRLSKVINKRRFQIEEKLYNTLIGSIVTTIGILSQKSEEEGYKEFRKLEKMSKKGLLDKYDTVLKLFNYVMFDYSELSDELKSTVVLVYDKSGIRSPLVSFMIDDNLMPISSSGGYTGVLLLASEGRENIGIEYLFEEITNDSEGLCQ